MQSRCSDHGLNLQFSELRTALGRPFGMNIPVQNLPGPGATDEIAELAGQYLLLPEREALARIDAEIARATDESRWDDLSKWHRVRFRLIRLHQIAAR